MAHEAQSARNCFTNWSTLVVQKGAKTGPVRVAIWLGRNTKRVAQLTGRGLKLLHASTRVQDRTVGLKNAKP